MTVTTVSPFGRTKSSVCLYESEAIGTKDKKPTGSSKITATSDSSVRDKTNSKRRRLSAPSLLEESSIRRITSSFQDPDLLELDESISPPAFVKTMLRIQGFDATEKPALAIEEGFFVEPTEEDFASYDQDLIQAVRKRDIATLRQVLREGKKSLQGCNRKGESLIHMACRRGFLEVVTFMIREAGVSIRVKDDWGRTPMHDACWTCEPNFELMELLLQEDPELVLISDKRGHTPFDYVRKEHWASWVEFLDNRRELLCPRELTM